MSQLPADIQRSIERSTGIPFADIADMDWEEIDRRIEQKVGKNLTFCPCDDFRLLPRGSVLLQLGRLILPQEITRRLSKIKVD